MKLIKYTKSIATIGLVTLLLTVSACQKKDADLGKEILIRVADRVMTVLDFKNAFEISKIAYDNDIKDQPDDLRDAQVRLLNELTVEMVLLKRAEELGITVSQAELDAAVSDIKSDYPEGEFEKTLLEFAVSYDSWQDRLRKRLILEKVIEEELKNRITITPEDITEYYEKHYQDQEDEAGTDQNTQDINETIVKQLRRQKAEESYNAWIEDLKGKYAIEINTDQWEKISGSKSIEEHHQSDSNVSKSD